MFAAWGTLRRGEVLGSECRRDLDVVAGSVWVERRHECHDGSLEIGPTKNGDPRRMELPVASLRPLVVDHLERFVDDAPDSPMFVGATGESLRATSRGGGSQHRGIEVIGMFQRPRHFAATMFASTGASTKEIMSRGGWKSGDDGGALRACFLNRDASLADALNRYTETGVEVPIGLKEKDRVLSAHDADSSAKYLNWGDEDESSVV